MVNKKNVVLEVKEKPYFVCPECGFEDYMGNTQFCPICEPEDANDQDFCYFVDFKEKLCRQDGEKCPFAKDRAWDSCPKLEGS